MAKKMEFRIEEDYTSLRQIDKFVSANENQIDDFLINTFTYFKQKH